MKIRMDKTLKEIVEQAYEEARLRRIGDFSGRERVFAEVLETLESEGDAMNLRQAATCPKLQSY
jgi:hypothetical protein